MTGKMRWDQAKAKQTLRDHAPDFRQMNLDRKADRLLDKHPAAPARPQPRPEARREKQGHLPCKVCGFRLEAHAITQPPHNRDGSLRVLTFCSDACCAAGGFPQFVIGRSVSVPA